ncbi:hypothetical protein [Geobacillus stearothermophilus]|uniref:hypothetical protein n=1 Tax=Geobacillus stearothermophilus TaxID=1422 RepID=UPI000BB1612A|nr:hypothetical protein GS458_0349 [Geobacillus stearothermophilus]
MKRIKLMVLSLGLYSCLSFSGVAWADDVTDPTATVEVTQNLYLEIPKDAATPEELQELTEMYESAGWVADGDYFVKQVSQKGVEVEANGETYQTDSNGVVEVPMDSEQDNVEVTVTASPVDEVKETYVVEPGTVTQVTQDVYLDDIIAEMGTDVSTENTNVQEQPSENVGTVSHGVSYSRGDTVHCNRFNGFLGDGKYYDKYDHPVLAARNFFQSDCDVALAWYTYCLSDYSSVASKRYCSLYSDVNKGHCSVLVGHSRKYHKHTGWFSPSN